MTRTDKEIKSIASAISQFGATTKQATKFTKVFSLPYNTMDVSDTKVNRDFFIRLYRRGQTRCPRLISMQKLRSRFGDNLAEKWRDKAYALGRDKTDFTRRSTGHRIQFAGR